MPHQRGQGNQDPNYLTYRWTIGEYASKMGVGAAEEVFTRASRGMIQYWKRKYESGQIPQSWGGKRWEKEKSKEIRYLILVHALANAASSLLDFKAMLAKHGHTVSKAYISRVFKSWKWNLKQPHHVAIHKFTAENITYYAHFLVWIQDIDPSRIHYFDESYFRSKALQKKRVWGPSGQSSQLITDVNFTEAYSLLLLTDLTNANNSYFVDLRQGTVDQYDVLNFFIAAVEKGILRQGDYLAMDNATLHSGMDMFPTLMRILTNAGVQLIWLPTYSPELNPCEMVFGRTKTYLRGHRNTSMPFWLEIFNALACVAPWEELMNWYLRCRSL